MSRLNEPLRFPGAALVTLVGAGPGDPELLTLKAARALQRASLVLYDSLVSKEVLQLAPPGAELVFVGKRCGQHQMTQQAIIDLMLRLAREGRPVLRLKGGDPNIFGRGGEEEAALAAHGIPFEVIPGISAAQGAAVCAGIPLTHRGHADTLVFATGHLSGQGEQRSLELDWPMLARARQTLVIYMGVRSLPLICERLIAHGMSPGTPAALVEQATLPGQRTVAGDLQSLPGLALAHDVQAPALIIIGSVVALRAIGMPAQAAVQPPEENRLAFSV